MSGSLLSPCMLLSVGAIQNNKTTDQRKDVYTHTVHLNEMICSLALHLNLSVVCGRVRFLLCVISTHTVPYASVKMLLHLMSPKAIKTEEDAGGIAHTTLIYNLPPESSPLIGP